MTSHLVIPDAHVQPDTNNDRFEWLGKFILERKPDKIICLGDFADMNSLCSYDRGKRSFEGRRYLSDCEAVKDALHRLNGPVDDYNNQRRRNGKSQYRPEKYMLLGNHEHRIVRATEDRAELDGTIGTHNLGFTDFGWRVSDYLVPVELDGIFYCHYFVSGVKGEAISGTNVASSILSKHMVSSVAGHCHIFDYAVRITPNGRKIMGLVPGCFFTHTMEYATHTEHLWWRGIAWLEDVHDGAYDLEMISIERLKKNYGSA